MEVFLVLIWFASIVIGISVGSKKGEGCISFAMCFLLGPIWLPVVLLSRGNRYACPFCKEMINKQAIICPHCKQSLIPIK
jgi:hypothetical protein